MLIDINKIDREQFQVESRGAWVLVRPPKIKHTWSPDELHLRSLLCRLDGEVISAGFPKFFNHGEKPEVDAEVDALIGAGRAVFTEKLDGSLIIRSLVDGRVHLRTRGNHDLGEFDGWVREAIARDYPLVLDPAIGGEGRSYLFEITSPLNRIVIAYETTKLTLIGRVDHSDLSVRRPSGSEAAMFGSTLPEQRPLTATDAKAAAAEVTTRRGDEGVVAWCERQDGTYLLSKFKSEWYLRAHALKSFATHDRVRDYIWSNSVKTQDEFVACLMRDGVDWETATQHSAIYCTVRDEIAHRLAALDDLTERLLWVRDLPDRKAKALALKDQAGDAFGVLIHLVTGDVDRYEEARTAHGLSITRAQFADLKRKGRQELVLDLDAARTAD